MAITKHVDCSRDIERPHVGGEYSDPTHSKPWSYVYHPSHCHTPTLLITQTLDPTSILTNCWLIRLCRIIRRNLQTARTWKPIGQLSLLPVFLGVLSLVVISLIDFLKIFPHMEEMI